MHNSTHETFLHYFQDKEMDEIYLGNALRSFASSMISIFIPIYFIKLGFSFVEVLWFYLLTHLVGVLIIFLAFRLIHKIGAKHVIFMSTLFQIGFFVLLHLLKTHYIPIIILSTINAIQLYFFWLPFHIVFARTSSTKENGSQLGIMTIFSSGLTIVGPLIGGIIISQFAQGYFLLFIFASILLLISGTVYLFSGDSKEVHKVNFKRSFNIIPEKDKLALIGNRIRTFTLAILWPVFMFLILGTTVSIGAVISGANLVLVLLTVYIGRLSDKKDKRKILKYGTISHGATAMFRGLATTINLIATFQILGALTFSFVNIPFRSMIYQKSKQHSISEYMFSQELFFRVISVIFISLLIILSSFMQPIIVISIAFVLAGLGSIMMNFLRVEEAPNFKEKMA